MTIVLPDWIYATVAYTPIGLAFFTLCASVGLSQEIKLGSSLLHRCLPSAHCDQYLWVLISFATHRLSAAGAIFVCLVVGDLFSLFRHLAHRGAMVESNSWHYDYRALFAIDLCLHGICRIESGFAMIRVVLQTPGTRPASGPAKRENSQSTAKAQRAQRKTETKNVL